MAAVVLPDKMAAVRANDFVLNIVLNIKIVYVSFYFRLFKNQGAKTTHKKIHESNRYISGGF
jgi:hypothetical protein